MTTREDYLPDDRSEGYKALGDSLSHFAIRLGVAVDDTTVQRWRALMGLMRDFDTYADEVASDIEPALAALANFSMFEAQYPSLTRQSLGDERFDALLDNTRTILQIGLVIKDETDANTFISARETEAVYSAEMLRIAATDEVRRQERFNLFMWHATGLGVSVNLADTLLDARVDFANSKTALEPDWAFYRQVGMTSLHHALPHLFLALDSTSVRLRSTMIAHRITNRLRNGITPYSNIHIVEGLWRRRPKE